MDRVIGYIPPAKASELPKAAPEGKHKETAVVEKAAKGQDRAAKAAPAEQ